MVGGRSIEITEKNSWKKETMPYKLYLYKYEFVPLMYKFKMSLKEVRSLRTKERKLLLDSLKDLFDSEEIEDG